jgi:hypothetical protein
LSLFVAFENIYETVEEPLEELEIEDKKAKEENKPLMKIDNNENQSDVVADTLNELAILQLTKGDDYER